MAQQRRQRNDRQHRQDEQQRVRLRLDLLGYEDGRHEDQERQQRIIAETFQHGLDRRIPARAPGGAGTRE
jgi:hypothetical protein